MARRQFVVMIIVSTLLLGVASAAWAVAYWKTYESGTVTCDDPFANEVKTRIYSDMNHRHYVDSYYVTDSNSGYRITQVYWNGFTGTHSYTLKALVSLYEANWNYSGSYASCF